MTNPKKKDTVQKPKIEINRRETSGKKKPDLFAKFRNTEHPLDGLIPDSEVIADKRVEKSVETHSTLPHPTLHERTIQKTTVDHPTVPHHEITNLPTSPTKNFTKFSNSIIKQAIPEGLFRGQSKHTYDVLYQATRGAISPKRQVQLTKSELVKLTGLEIKTIQRHLSFLKSVGLIIVDPKIGDHKGAIYEVRIPEELPLPYPTLEQSSTPNPTAPKVNINTHPDPSIDSTMAGSGKTIENKEFVGNLKTSLKTLKYIDDEAPIINAIEKLNEMAQKLTGKDLTKRDLEKFSDLLEILISETIVAAARTGTVSAIVPFMTENLRRRLYSKPRSTGKKEEKPKHLNVGKGSEQHENSESSWTPQTTLTEEQRQNTLNALKEAKAADSVLFREFKAYGEIEYTTEDFRWLLENLEKGS